MIREYLTPDFDITVYEIEDVITGSSPGIGGNDPDEEKPGQQWWG
jgi:hypothetical protein